MRNSLVLSFGLLVGLAVGCSAPRPGISDEERLVRGGYGGRWDQVAYVEEPVLPGSGADGMEDPVLYELNLEASEW